MLVLVAREFEQIRLPTWGKLNPILATTERSFLSAGVAGPLNDESMVFDPEPMSTSDFVAKSNKFLACKLDQLSTLGAVEVVVFGITVIEFVHATAVEFKAMQ